MQLGPDVARHIKGIWTVSRVWSFMEEWEGVQPTARGQEGEGRDRDEE